MNGMDRTEREYHTAAGYCLDAMQSLRRFSGKEAIDALQSAIRTIENEQRRAQREDRLRFGRVQAEPPVRPPIVEF